MYKKFCFGMIVLWCLRLELLCRGSDGQVETQMCIFGFRLTQDSLGNSPNIDKQLLFPIGSPNCTLSTFPGDGGWLENVFLWKSLSPTWT